MQLNSGQWGDRRAGPADPRQEELGSWGSEAGRDVWDVLEPPDPVVIANPLHLPQVCLQDTVDKMLWRAEESRNWDVKVTEFTLHEAEAVQARGLRWDPASSAHHVADLYHF